MICVASKKKLRPDCPQAAGLGRLQPIDHIGNMLVICWDILLLQPNYAVVQAQTGGI